MDDEEEESVTNKAHEKFQKELSRANSLKIDLNAELLQKLNDDNSIKPMKTDDTIRRAREEQYEIKTKIDENIK